MLHIPRLAALLFCFALMSSCTSTGTRQANEEAAIPPDVDKVLTGRDNVRDNPSAYVDKVVLAKGEIKEILSSNAFILDYGGGILGIGDKKILVIPRAPEAAQTPISVGSKVEVIGVIRLFNLLQTERELGVELNEKIFKKYENQPVLLARSILKRSQEK